MGSKDKNPHLNGFPYIVIVVTLGQQYMYVCMYVVTLGQQYNVGGKPTAAEVTS